MKNKRIKDLVDYLQKKHSPNEILITDFWDADNAAIGITDKTKQYLVYISVNNMKKNQFYISLENPSTSIDFPYTPAGDFNDIDLIELEKHVVSHLKLYIE